MTVGSPDDVNRVRSPSVTALISMSFARAVSAIDLPERVSRIATCSDKCARPRRSFGSSREPTNTPALHFHLRRRGIADHEHQEPIRELARFDARPLRQRSRSRECQKKRGANYELFEAKRDAAFGSGAGKRQRKRGPDAHLTLGPKIASHSTREITADRETESDSLVRTREPAVDLDERLEHPRKIVVRNSDAAVGDDNLHLIAVGASMNVDTTAIPRELDCIAERVEHDLLHLFTIRTHCECGVGNRSI